MGFGTRQPTSNEGPDDSLRPWGADEMMDDVALLLSGMAKRCYACLRAVRTEFQKNHGGHIYCPDDAPPDAT